MATTEITVENPATGGTAGVVAALGDAEVAQLVARARAAQAGWGRLTIPARAEILARCRRALVAERAAVGRTLRAETGKPHDDALLFDVLGVADAMRFWERHGEAFLRDETIRPRHPMLPGRRVVVRRRPLGVVGVIAPWNYPLVLGVGDAIPALLAGNAVVLKPSEVTPLASVQLADVFRRAGLPADLLLIATGAGETGAALVDHADMIMFTGSTSTGRRIAARAAERLIPVSLELGGKDAMIVCADADLDRAAEVATTYGLQNSGQLCMSIERIYVEAPVYDGFVAKLLERAAKVRPRPDGGPGEGDYGAMTFPPQIDTVQRHVDDAVAKGARVLTGGAPLPGPARVYPPTVLVGVDHSMACMREETFGPTLPVMRVADVDEAVELANDSSYGLTASVLTRDVEKGRAIAERLEAGNACVNEAVLCFLARDAPFGGARDSGLGVRHGPDGIRKYTQPQTIMLTRSRPRRELHYFPGSPRTSRAMERFFAWRNGR